MLKHAISKVMNVDPSPRSVRREPVERVTTAGRSCPANLPREIDMLDKIAALRASIERARGMVRCVISAARHSEALSADIADALEGAYREIREAEHTGKAIGDFVQEQLQERRKRSPA